LECHFVSPFCWAWNQLAALRRISLRRPLRFKFIAVTLQANLVFHCVLLFEYFSRRAVWVRLEKYSKAELLWVRLPFYLIPSDSRTAPHRAALFFRAVSGLGLLGSGYLSETQKLLRSTLRFRGEHHRGAQSHSALTAQPTRLGTFLLSAEPLLLVPLKLLLRSKATTICNFLTPLVSVSYSRF